MKDYFSKQSDLYARFRPAYPPELYDFLLRLVPGKSCAWDCGTGNGQVAAELANHFTEVVASDISENQLRNAVRKKNISYSIQPAEGTSFPQNAFDLITAAQALHWFRFDAFFNEVNRTLKPDGIVAVFGYTRCTIDTRVDAILDELYHNIVGSYWDKERKYVVARYAMIPFPFKEIDAPAFAASYSWTLEHLIGYLGTWSAVQHYIDRNASSPIEKILNDLRGCWEGEITKRVTFPVFMRVGAKLAQ